MAERGRLVVLEGPDGVGKSALAQAVTTALTARGIDCTCLSFPGREEGTLGWHIYQLHHDPKRFGINEVAPSSLQLLHIAAHLDAIANRILPALRAGRMVILDRFWWSTWAYGIVAGIGKQTLEAMLAVEHAAWEGVVPSLALLVRRSRPLRDDTPPKNWQDLTVAYEDLALTEGSRYPVRVLDNEGLVAEIAAQVIETLDGLRFRVSAPPRLTKPSSRPAGRRPPRRASLEPDLFTSAPTVPVRGDDCTSASLPKQTSPQVICWTAPAKPSEVYDTYWRFAAERQSIFFRRIEGTFPLTDDPILARYKFTNAYRASDRVSQYLIRSVIYQDDQSPEEVFFRTILFKLFNKIETWELLKERLGNLSWTSFNFERYAGVLDEAIRHGERIYSAAYIMPSGSGKFEDRRKHRSHLKLLQQMMADKLAQRIADCRSMRKAFELIRSYPMIGDFLAYQYVTDLNYSTLCEFSEREFVLPGPGARDGIRKCFHSLGGLSEADMIRWVTDHQEQEFARLEIGFRSLWGRPLQLIDAQNLFCEVDKYARLAHPHIKGVSGRTRIKQLYRPSLQPIRFWYPPKWEINAKVQATQRGVDCDDK
jgi:thymidylate kinase